MRNVFEVRSDTKNWQLPTTVREMVCLVTGTVLIWHSYVPVSLTFARCMFNIQSGDCSLRYRNRSLGIMFAANTLMGWRARLTFKLALKFGIGCMGCIRSSFVYTVIPMVKICKSFCLIHDTCLNDTKWNFLLAVTLLDSQGFLHQTLSNYSAIA